VPDRNGTTVRGGWLKRAVYQVDGAPVSPREVPRSITGASVQTQRRLATFGLVLGFAMVAGSASHSGVARAALVGFGLANITLGSLLAWTAWFTVRNINQPPEFWQHLQGRWRARLTWLFGIVGGSLVVGGGLLLSAGYRSVGAGIAVFGGVFALIAAAMVVGGIKPIRYV
jgi:hypothetical protein